MILINNWLINVLDILSIFNLFLDVFSNNNFILFSIAIPISFGFINFAAKTVKDVGKLLGIAAATGAAGKAGSDAWDAAKDKIKKITSGENEGSSTNSGNSNSNNTNTSDSGKK
jgi:hypothetical protein